MLRAGRDRAVFGAWTAAVRATLRRHGARLELDAPHGARLASAPRIEITDWGRAGDARLQVRVGRDVQIGRRVVVEVFPGGTNVLDLGDGTVIGDDVRVQLRGGAVHAGPGSRIRSQAILKADGEIVLRGRNEVSYGVVFHCAGRIEVGEGTGIAERVSVLDSDHTADGSDRDFYAAPLRVDPVVIESNVFIAANVVITRGTHIGRNSVVAASAVLTGQRSYPPGSLIAGAPARLVRMLSDGQAPTSDA
jgi:acetyltransferase-like isoleucine patch superfamily enzyme